MITSILQNVFKTLFDEASDIPGVPLCYISCRSFLGAFPALLDNTSNFHRDFRLSLRHFLGLLAFYRVNMIVTCVLGRMLARRSGGYSVYGEIFAIYYVQLSAQ